jgi:hypothetical protein
VAPARRLDPRDDLAPSLLLAFLLFQSLPLQLLQPLDALDGRGFLRYRDVSSISSYMVKSRVLRRR